MTKKEIVTSDEENKNDIEKNLRETANNLSDIASNLWKLGSFTIKTAYKGASIVVENTPKVIVATAEARRKVTETIVDTYEAVQTKKKEKEFDDKFAEKIEHIKLKQKLQISDTKTRPKHYADRDDLD